MDFLTPERATLVGVLCSIIIAGYKKMWVWGYQLKDAERQRDKWQELALSTTNLAERSTRIAEKQGADD